MSKQKPSYQDTNQFPELPQEKFKNPLGNDSPFHFLGMGSGSCPPGSSSCDEDSDDEEPDCESCQDQCTL